MRYTHENSNELREYLQTRYIHDGQFQYAVYDQITKELMEELKRLQEQYDDPIRFAQAQK